MKTIGIIVAMGKEMNLLLPLMAGVETRTLNGFTFHCGTIGRHKAVAMQCGIGKVNAAIGCMTLIDAFAPDVIINTGVAGGTGSDARILDVVVGESVGYYDVWCGPETVPGEAAGCPQLFHPSAELLALPCFGRNPRVRKGLIASGDMFVDNPELLAHILEIYPEAKAVDMESGALAQTCYLRNVPFLSLRVVSDTPGQVDDNAAQYDNFWNDAPVNAFNLLTDIMNEID